MATTTANSFSKSLRLIKKVDFTHLKQGSSKISRTPLVCYYKNSRLSTNSRIGFSLSRKIAKAHDRNRYKRILRELFRQNLSLQELKQDFLFVFIQNPISDMYLRESFNSIVQTLKNKISERNFR